MLTAVTGINWGDEGKGRVIDLLAENADIVARYQGGNNAGHTVVTEKGKFILNLLPSGILHPDVTCVLGTGMVIDLDHLANEMQAIKERGVEIDPENLKLSDKATISMPWHKVQDALFSWCKTQAEKFAPYICDVGAFLQQAHDSGKRIVLEAQLGAMRDIDYGICRYCIRCPVSTRSS